MSNERTLILVRHGKSAWNDDMKADFERPLKKRGARESFALGRWFETHGHAPDLIITSAAVRAWETTRAIVSALDSPCDVRVEQSLYHATSHQIVEAVDTVDSRYATVAVIGHNPGMEELASALAGRDITMKTACACVLHVTGQWSSITPSRTNYECFVRGRLLKKDGSVGES